MLVVAVGVEVPDFPPAPRHGGWDTLSVHEEMTDASVMRFRHKDLFVLQPEASKYKMSTTCRHHIRLHPQTVCVSLCYTRSGNETLSPYFIHTVMKSVTVTISWNKPHYMEDWSCRINTSLQSPLISAKRQKCINKCKKWGNIITSLKVFTKKIKFSMGMCGWVFCWQFNNIFFSLLTLTGPP